MNDVGALAKLGGWIVAIASVIVSVVLWVQSQGDSKYYPRISGENLEKDIAQIEHKLESIESGNREIIRLLGRLEGERER
jgi:hypothetical protein